MFAAGGLARATINASDSNRAQIGGAATFFVFLYTAIFGATWLTVPWLYPAEIFPLQVRAKGNAWGVVGWSIGNGWCVSTRPRTQTIELFAKFVNSRSFFYPPSSISSKKRPCTSLAPSTPSASSPSGRCTPSPTSARSRRWIWCLPATASGHGTPSATLPSLRPRIRTSLGATRTRRGVDDPERGIFGSRRASKVSTAHPAAEKEMTSDDVEKSTASHH